MVVLDFNVVYVVVVEVWIVFEGVVGEVVEEFVGVGEIWCVYIFYIFCCCFIDGKVGWDFDDDCGDVLLC